MPARQGGARRPVLLVVYLERLNHTLRALIGAFSVTTEAALKDQQALDTTSQSTPCSRTQ